MAKKKNNQTVVNNIDSVNLNIDCDELAEAIVKAQLKAEKQKQKEIQDAEKKQKEEILQKRKTVLKEKDFSYINCKQWRNIRIFLNSFRMFFNILFMRKESIKYFSAVDSLISSANGLLLRIFRFILYLVVLVCVVFAFQKINILLCVIVAFTSLTIAQLIRIAENEVGNIHEREYSIAIFSGLISVFSLIISVISIFVSK